MHTATIFQAVLRCGCAFRSGVSFSKTNCTQRLTQGNVALGSEGK
jgi:hypothetical protein